MSEDILHQIPDEDIPKIKEIYRNKLPSHLHAYNYLNSIIRWKKQRPDKNYVTLFTPQGNWKNGTIIGIHKYNCNELFISTLDEDVTKLVEALLKTDRIEWNNNLYVYAVLEKYNSSIISELKETVLQPDKPIICDIWWMPHEQALNLEIEASPEVYLEELKPIHAEKINSYWPYRFTDSEVYVATLIEMNGGCGVFLKKDGTLVAWVLRTHFGLGLLQTVDEHQQKGYGSLVAKVLSKQIAKDGLDPMGTIVQNNVASEKMFGKIGFQFLETVVYTTTVEFSNQHVEESESKWNKIRNDLKLTKYLE